MEQPETFEEFAFSLQMPAVDVQPKMVLRLPRTDWPPEVEAALKDCEIKDKMGRPYWRDKPVTKPDGTLLYPHLFLTS